MQQLDHPENREIEVEHPHQRRRRPQDSSWTKGRTGQILSLLVMVTRFVGAPKNGVSDRRQ